MKFVEIRLELVTPLHVGAGRAGMVSRARGFVPGHVLAYALAASLGRKRGGRAENYEDAVMAVRAGIRCGPLLLWTGREALFPRRDRSRIEMEYFCGVNHTAIDGEMGRNVDGGLYEVEAIAPRPRRTDDCGPTELRGGMWFEEETLSGSLLRDVVGACVLGGERNAGMGRIRLTGWDCNAKTYVGVGRVKDCGRLWLRREEVLPGPALDGVRGAGWEPWFGRLYDRQRGAGRRFSEPVMVRMDGKPGEEGYFELESSENGFGCWKSVCTRR